MQATGQISVCVGEYVESRAQVAEPFKMVFYKGNSDGFVGVEHNTESVATHGGRRKVLGELGADEARVAVAARNLAPDSLLVCASLLVLSFVDVGNALSVVPGR